MRVLAQLGLAFACLVWVAIAKAEPASSAEPTLSDAQILEEAPAHKRRLRVENLRLRFTFFDQRGRGYQSKAGPPQGPGDERLLVYQPMASIKLRQRDERFAHDLSFALDVVSSASADALDAVSSASRVNEAARMAGTSSFEPDGRSQWSLSYGINAEEHWRGAFGGFGYSGDLGEHQTTTVSASINYIWDIFDNLHPRGWNTDQGQRHTLNNNLGLTQILSPTTLAHVSYGLTYQVGALATPWNSTYISDADTYACHDDPTQRREYDCLNRRGERFDRTRTRHAIAGTLAQHIPRTRTTLKTSYRYYRDDFTLRAHTWMGRVYQWFGRRFYARLTYRFHHQTGVDFFQTSVTRFPNDGPITSDSDLAPFFAHEGGLKGVVYITPPHSARGGAQYLDAGYTRYQRTNDLSINVFSVGYGVEF